MKKHFSDKILSSNHNILELSFLNVHLVVSTFRKMKRFKDENIKMFSFIFFCWCLKYLKQFSKYLFSHAHTTKITTTTTTTKAHFKTCVNLIFRVNNYISCCWFLIFIKITFVVKIIINCLFITKNKPLCF